jgi:hypothetical protein
VSVARQSIDKKVEICWSGRKFMARPEAAGVTGKWLGAVGREVRKNGQVERDV